MLRVSWQCRKYCALEPVSGRARSGAVWREEAVVAEGHGGCRLPSGSGCVPSAHCTLGWPQFQKGSWGSVTEGESEFVPCGAAVRRRRPRCGAVWCAPGSACRAQRWQLRGSTSASASGGLCVTVVIFLVPKER